MRNSLPLSVQKFLLPQSISIPFLNPVIQLDNCIAFIQWKRGSSLGRSLYLRGWKPGSSIPGSAAARYVWKACRVAPATLSLALPCPAQRSPHKPERSEEGRPSPFAHLSSCTLESRLGWTTGHWSPPPSGPMGEPTLLRSAVPFRCYSLCDSSWLPQKDLLGHHFLRMLAFLTLLIRKLFVIAKGVISLCPEVTAHHLA